MLLLTSCTVLDSAFGWEIPQSSGCLSVRYELLTANYVSHPLAQVKKWRRQLHTWDVPPSAGEQPVFTAGPANAFAPADASPDAATTHGRRTAQTTDAAGQGLAHAVCLVLCSCDTCAQAQPVVSAEADK